MDDTCYMCHKPASTREHAPPLCFFPEAKDLEPPQDLRKHLITVPSCPDHNLSASKDDEYALVLVVSHFKSNAVGKQQFNTKVVRALRRSPAFTAQTYARRAPVLLDGSPTFAFQVDDARFELVMTKTSRAIYFNHTAKKLLRRVIVYSTAFRTTDKELATAYGDAAAIGAQLFRGAERRGANQEVFYYQLVEDQNEDQAIMRMVFFEGFDVFVTWGRRVDAA